MSPFMRVLFGAKTIVQAREAYKCVHGFFYFLSKLSPKMALPAPRGELVADRVTFALGGRILLREVSFALKPGEFLGLVGPNGAGKTTLLRVLLGPFGHLFSGPRRLDGVSLHWDKGELGPYVGYLPQEVELFPLTVAENIARMGSVDMDEVTRVCRTVGQAWRRKHCLAVMIRWSAGLKVVPFRWAKAAHWLGQGLYGSPRLLLLTSRIPISMKRARNN